MQSAPPDHLRSFYKQWAAVLHKIYPEFTKQHVATVLQQDATSDDVDTGAIGTNFSLVFLKLSQLHTAMVEHFCRSGGNGTKDSVRADNIRLQGCRMLDEASGGRQLMGVAEIYNRSLAFAEAESRAMFKGFDLRSVLCSDLGQFGLCLKNIEKALEEGDVDDINKTLKLKRFCLERGEGLQETVEEFEATLSFEANPTVPNVVDGIELEVNGLQGRHLMAKKLFNFGDILMIDDPYVVVADPCQQYRQCHHCLKFCSLQLLPCHGCVEVMFCSPECAKIAQQRYHRFECPILRGLYALDKIGRMAIIVARMIFTAISSFNDDLDALCYHINTIDKDLHPFKINWTTITPQQRYSAIYALATNKGVRDSETNNSFAVVAIFAAELMLLKTPLMVTLADTQPKQDLIRTLVYHHALTVGTSVRNANPDRSLGAYPLASMVNHGCCAEANVMRIGLPGGRIAIMATRSIAPGEQILEDYTFNLMDATHTDRHRYLRWAYQINQTCQCADPVVDEATLVWEGAIAQALNDLSEVEMKQCEREDLAVLMERVPTWMRMLEPSFGGAAKVRERFVRMTRHLYELAFNGWPEEERYDRIGQI